MEPMKKKISITIEEKHVDWIDEQIKTLRFRNRSHAIDYALDKFIESEKERDVKE